jgi:hypothetical protein
VRGERSLVRARPRAKNEAHAVLARSRCGRPPISDCFGKAGRAWLAALELPVDERLTLDGCLRQSDFLHTLRLDDRNAGPRGSRTRAIGPVPDLFAAVAVHSGLSYRSAASLGAAFGAMARGGEDPTGQGRAAHAAMGDFARPVPCMVVHGSADPIVAPVNADQVLQQSMTANRLAAPETCDLDFARPTTTSRGQVDGGHAYTRCRWTDRRGALMHKLLKVDGLGHAWSGGVPGGSRTDPRGPDATEAIWRFFSRATADQPAG